MGTQIIGNLSSICREGVRFAPNSSHSAGWSRSSRADGPVSPMLAKPQPLLLSSMMSQAEQCRSHKGQISQSTSWNKICNLASPLAPEMLKLMDINSEISVLAPCALSIDADCRIILIGSKDGARIAAPRPLPPSRDRAIVMQSFINRKFLLVIISACPPYPMTRCQRPP